MKKGSASIEKTLNELDKARKILDNKLSRLKEKRTSANEFSRFFNKSRI